jgi:hypothetical protein
VIKVAETPILEKSDHFSESQSSWQEALQRGFKDNKIDLLQKPLSPFENQMLTVFVGSGKSF